MIHARKYRTEMQKIKEIIINDEISEFMKFEDKKLEGIRLIHKFETILELSIKYGNKKKITCYLAKKNGVYYCDYLKLINNLTLNKKNLEEYNSWQTIFLNIFLYNKASTQDIGNIIDKLVKIKEWIIIDYLHIFGFRANNKNLLINNYPKILLKRLESYGYDINDRKIKDLIKEGKDLDQQLINKIDFEKWVNDICKYRDDKLIDKLMNQKIIDIKDIKSNNCVSLSCQHMNFPLLKYLIKMELYPAKEDIYKLFGLESLSVKTKRKKIHNWRYRYRFRLKYNKIKNMNKEYPQNYEKNMIEIIDQLGEKFKIKNKEEIWLWLLNHRFFVLFKKLKDLLHKIKINDFSKNDITKEIIKNDEVESFKKIIELEVIKINQGTRKQQMQYMNLAIKFDCKNIIKYLKDELHTNCSKNILNIINWNGNKIDLDFIKNLETINFPIKEEVLNKACENGNIELIKYLVEEKKINLTKKHFITALSTNKSKQLVNYIKSNIKGYPKKNLIDKILIDNKKRRRYRRNSFIKNIKYIKDTLEGTASEKALYYALEIRDLKLFKYLHKEFKLKIEPELLDNMPTRYYYGSNNLGKFYGYIIQHLDKQQLNNDRINNIAQISFESNDIETLEFLGKEFNYKPKLQDITRIITYYYCTTDIIDYVMRNLNDFVFQEDMIDLIMGNRNVHILNHLYDNYKSKIPFENIFTLKKINTYVALGYGNIDFFYFVIEKLNKKITSYTIELYLKKSFDYAIEKCIKYLLDQIQGISENLIEIIKSKNIKKSKYIISKYKKVNNYEPLQDEIPENINILLINNLDYDDEDVQDVKIDEVEEAIKEAENKIEEEEEDD